MSDSQKPLKVIILGDVLVGKTSILNTLSSKKQSQGKLPPAKFTWVTVGQREVRLQLIQAPFTKYKNVTKNMVRDAQGAFLVCDVSEGFKDQIPTGYLKHLEQAGVEVPVILLCNKVDLCTRRPPIAEIEQFCRARNCAFLLSSAKTGLNLRRAAQMMAERIMSSSRCYMRQARTTVQLQNSQKRSRRIQKGCC